jgi:hypothetical protein
MPNRVPLSELVAAGILLRPAEAVAIVGEICRQRAARVLPGLPSVNVVRLTSHGEIVIEGPVPAGHDAVTRAGHLLDALLPGYDAPPEYRASGALRLAVARATGSLDLPPYASLEEFCAALVRFSTLDARDTVSALVAAYNAAKGTTLAAAEPVAAIAVEPAAPRAQRPWLQFAVWVSAPAAAAVLGYVLALPSPKADAPRPDVPTAESRQATPPPAAAAVPAPEPTPAIAERAPAPLQASGPRVVQAAAYSPAFAPGGEAMYFHQQKGSVSALKRADTVAGVVRNVTSIVDDSARNFHPRPSPDGRQIAFDSDRDGVRGVYVADADGSGARRISGSGFASVPSWSPDGRQIAFARAEASSANVWNLWIVDVDGSNLRRLTRHRVGQAWGGSWFPDGRRIAYSVEDTLVILNLASGDARALSSPRAGRLVRTPAVSPDGTRIVFQVYHDGTWIADARTGEMQRVLADPSAEEFTWAPDGRHVAFHSRRTGSWSVWMMPI